MRDINNNKSKVSHAFFRNGSTVEVNAAGRELQIGIQPDYDIYEPWADISINGAVVSRQMLMAG